jgi:hypothetical protein
MSIQRQLTEYEIDSILSFIKPQQGIPEETALSVFNANINQLKKQLVGKQIYPEMIPDLRQMIEKQYNSSKIQPGESVGVIGAQSIGEKQTQSTLNTFHKAGSGEKTVTVGVPRVEEMLNATKDPKSINCFVYTKKNHLSIAELRETIGHHVVEITFSKITKHCDIVMDKKPEKWYGAFEIINGDNYKSFQDCISLQIDMDILYEYILDMQMISNIISTEYSDMVCVFSPDSIGQLDIYVDTSNIDLPESRLVFINTDNAKEIYLEEVVLPILYKIVISGVPGIDNIFFNDDPNNFETNGSNFKQLLGLPFVDDTKTTSNNVWDIYKTLGVEAARQFLIEEFMQLCSGINKCHIQLLAEKMTHTGSVSSISRYTMRNEECGPMGKASFEETMDNFLKAGAYGQKEATRGVSASIICGKRANIGTGVCELIMDVDALPNCVRVLNDVNENTVTNNNYIEKPYNQKLEQLENRLEIKKNSHISNYDENYIQENNRQDTQEETIRMTEKHFDNCKYKANVLFGHAEINITENHEESESQENIIMTYDSKEPREVTLRWKQGIRFGKEVFAGFDSKYGVYIPFDYGDLEEQ